MADGKLPGAPSEEWTTIALRKTTKEKLDRVGGTSASNDAKVDGALDVIVRERLVDKVRRKILGVAEKTGEFVEGGITGADSPPPREPRAR